MANRKNKRNEGIMKVLKSLHSVKDNMDLERQRETQEKLGYLLSKNPNIDYECFKIDKMNVEWIHYNKCRDSKHIILYFHGGGYISGNLPYARILGSKLAQHVERDVLSIDYRLAPAFSYPAQLEDALKAWEFLLEQGYQPSNISLAGESAGGNLVLAFSVYLKQKNMPMPRTLVCMSPWTDLLATGKTYKTKRSIEPMLTEEFLQSATTYFSGDAELSNPLVSPMYADFEGFPPTLIQVGTNEILLSDSVQVFKKMKKAGVECRIEIWEGLWHVFQMFPLPKSTRALQNIAIFLDSY